MIIVILITSCATKTTVTKKQAYPNMYEEEPLSILVMPPINRTTHTEAKEWFMTTLMQPVAFYGYYAFPSILTTEILKNESAFDSEMYVDGPLEKFNEVFGADALLFTTINKWDKDAVRSFILININYVLKSAKTNEIIWSNTQEIKYDTSVDTYIPGLLGLVADLAASAINTGVTDYVPIARQVNFKGIADIPYGKYHPRHAIDTEDLSIPPITEKEK